MENFLQEKIQEYNDQIPNKYKKNWGSIFDFLYEGSLDPKQDLAICQYFKDAQITSVDLSKEQPNMQRVRKTAPSSPNQMFNTSTNFKVLNEVGSVRQSFQERMSQLKQRDQIAKKEEIFPFRNKRKIVVQQNQSALSSYRNSSLIENAVNAKDYSQVYSGRESVEQSTTVFRRSKLKTQQNSPVQSAFSQYSKELKELRSQTRSKIASYRSKFHTALGTDIRQFGHPSKVDPEQIFLKSKNMSKNNHLQKAVQKTAELNIHEQNRAQNQSKLNKKQSNNSIPDSQNNCHDQVIENDFERMYKQFRQKVGDSRQFKEPQMPDSIKEIMEKMQPKSEIQSLMNFTSQQFLNLKKTEKWMENHQFSKDKYRQNQSNIEFAKELFQVWDKSQSGKLEINQLTEALMALGLSTDSIFVKILLNSIDKTKFKQMDENQVITLNDFVKIFKRDQTGDKIVKVIKDEIISQRQSSPFRHDKRSFQKSHIANCSKVWTDRERKKIEKQALPLVNSKEKLAESKFKINFDQEKKKQFEKLGQSQRDLSTRREVIVKVVPLNPTPRRTEIKEVDVDVMKRFTISYIQPQNELAERINNIVIQEAPIDSVKDDVSDYLQTKSRPNSQNSTFSKLGIRSYQKQEQNSMNVVKSQQNSPKPEVCPPLQLSQINSVNNQCVLQKVNQVQIESLSLNDLLSVVRKWWIEVDEGRGDYFQPVEKVAQLLVRRKIAVESDTATRIIWQAIKKRKMFLSWEDFNMIFCKGIFREVLISLAQKLTEKNEIPLQNSSQQEEEKRKKAFKERINEYQRKLMLEQVRKNGNQPQSQQKRIERPVLEALFKFKQEKRLFKDGLQTYKEFRYDPFGKERKEKEQRKRQEEQIDQFAKDVEQQMRENCQFMMSPEDQVVTFQH